MDDSRSSIGYRALSVDSEDGQGSRNLRGDSAGGTDTLASSPWLRIQFPVALHHSMIAGQGFECNGDFASIICGSAQPPVGLIRICYLLRQDVYIHTVGKVTVLKQLSALTG